MGPKIGVLLGLTVALAFSMQAAKAASSTKVIGDRTNYQAGQYTGYMSPFNSKLLHAGDTYSETMTVTPASFPAVTKFDFAYPAGYQSPGGVWGYLAVDYGNYYSTAALAPITPRQVKSITTLTQTQSLSIGGNITGLNVIFDAFLTKAANDFSNRVIEIDWQLHPSDPARYWIAGLTSHGTWTDANGQPWSIYTDPSTTAPVVMYVLPAVGHDKLTGSINIKALLNWMTTAKLITGNEYYNGHGVGAEPVQGSGSLTVNSLSVTYN